LSIADYTTSTLRLAEAADWLRSGPGPTLVVTHAKPDGDAFGSVVALVLTLQQLGHDTRGVLVPPVPESLRQLPGADAADTWHVGYRLPFEPTRVVVVDTGAWSQVGPLRAEVEPRLEQTLILDHHLSGDIPAARRYVDGSAAAACEIIAVLTEGLLKDAGQQRSAEVRDALFVGIASDTGWFRFSNVRPQTHELAAELIRTGTDHATLYQKLEQTERPEKLALMSRALQSLSFHADGRAVIMSLRERDFIETGARPEETERLIDAPQMVGQLRVFVVATEARGDNGRPVTRLSFRSKPDGEQAVNVAELAGRFGGGGHARAAGARVDGAIDEVLPRIARELEQI
jgi:phosphoesterase RecJ-like protein